MKNYFIETISGHVLFMTFSLKETTQYNEVTQTEHIEEGFKINKIAFKNKADGFINLVVIYPFSLT